MLVRPVQVELTLIGVRIRNIRVAVGRLFSEASRFNLCSQAGERKTICIRRTWGKVIYFDLRFLVCNIQCQTIIIREDTKVV